MGGTQAVGADETPMSATLPQQTRADLKKREGQGDTSTTNRLAPRSKISEPGIDPGTSGLWAPHATTAPL